MKILINTDKTIRGDERNQDFYTTLIENELQRFNSHISRIEVHISDQNGKKDGHNDIICMLEARLEGRKPIAVSHQSGTINEAVSGAVVKLSSSLKTLLGRIEKR